MGGVVSLFVVPREFKVGGQRNTELIMWHIWKMCGCISTYLFLHTSNVCLCVCVREGEREERDTKRLVRNYKYAKKKFSTEKREYFF
jgi:hypothetical protein